MFQYQVAHADGEGGEGNVNKMALFRAAGGTKLSRTLPAFTGFKGQASSRRSSPEFNITELLLPQDRLCGLVVRVPGCRSGGPGSIPGTNRKKKFSGTGTGCTQPREYKLRSYLIDK
jgi:hypothetical protein